MVLAHNINEGSRTQDVQITEDVTFDTMLLAPNTLEGLFNCNFSKPSPIQLHGIPLGKCGFDLLLEAKSGTGKTAVFTVITLEKLDLDKGLQTIILAPTREIAAQISDVITQIGSSYKNFNVAVVIGGLPLIEDIAKFKKKVHVVVGSPGRLRHLIQANHIDVSTVRLLVLDEADKLMDKNFQADINYIFSVLPKDKQVIMSSATYPEMLKSVMGKYLQNAQHVCPDSTSVLIGIKQLVVVVKSNSNIVRQTQNRFEELLNILSKKNFKQCLIFCNYQVRVRDLCKMLMREKWPAEQLHGQQEQTDRLDALKTLQEYKCRILVSTDLAARGIDASNIDLVINFEPPYDWQTYLHRIGRAGRFGSYGIAISILSEGSEEIKFKKMIKAINSKLDLQNLWDGEKIDLDECDFSPDVSVYQGIESNNAFNDLLNKLTQGEEKVCKDSSCKSIEKTKENEIESFNDLLSCFEFHTVGNNSSCNIKNTEPKTEYASNIMETNALLQLSINNEMEENIVKIRDTLKFTDDSQNFKKNIEALGKLKKRCETHLKSHNKTNIIGRPNSKEIHTDNTFDDLESDEYYMNEKALLDAGLPVSFSSSKSCLSKQKKIHSKHLNENIQHKLSCNKINETGYKSRNFSVEQKGSNLDMKNCLNRECRTNFSNGQIEESKYQSNLDILNKNKRKDSKKYDRIDGSGMAITCDVHKNYGIWYNQLKTRIKLIQMSLYIEELSNI